MGFSLLGNSGSSSSNTTNYNYSASLNPQLDFQGAAGGNLGINISPLAQGGATGEIDPSIFDYYAPVSITSVGAAQGDQALQTLGQLAQTTADATSALSSSNSGSSSSTLSGTLSQAFSGNAIYWILGSIVIFFLAEK